MRAASLVLLPGGRLVHGLHSGRLVEQDDPTLGVESVTGILETPEVDVGHSLVRLVHHADTDVAVLPVLPVQGVPHHVVTGLLVEAGHTDHFVAASLLGRLAGRGRSAAEAGAGASPVAHN